MIHDRIKEVRLALGYKSQEDFGVKINLTRSAISLLEGGKRNPSDRTLSDICRVFDINEHWLRTGEGEMFKDIEDDFDYLVGRYGEDLPDNIKELFKILLKMSPEKRKAFDDFLAEYDKMRGK